MKGAQALGTKAELACESAKGGRDRGEKSAF